MNLIENANFVFSVSILLWLKNLTCCGDSIIIAASGCGGTVDALASGASEGNLVGVQVPSAAKYLRGVYERCLEGYFGSFYLS